MTRDQVRTAQELLVKRLAEIEKEIGFKLSLKGCVFSDVATFKLEVSPMSEDGSFVSKEAADFKRYAESFGLSADDLNKTIVINGEQAKIIGCKPSSSKYPILIEKNGKKFKYPAETIKFCLNSSKA